MWEGSFLPHFLPDLTSQLCFVLHGRGSTPSLPDRASTAPLFPGLSALSPFPSSPFPWCPHAKDMGGFCVTSLHVSSLSVSSLSVSSLGVSSLSETLSHWNPDSSRNLLFWQFNKLFAIWYSIKISF